MSDQNGNPCPVPWRVADAALAMAAIAIGFLLLLFLLGVVISAGEGVGRTILTPFFLGALDGVILVAVWVFGVRKYQTGWRAVGLRPPESPLSFAWPWLALVGSLGFAGVYLAVVTALGLGSLEPSPLPEGILGHGITRLLNSAVLVVCGPFAEEVFFRGFLLAALVAPLGTVRAVVVSSAVFAAAHLMLSTMIPIFVTGMLLSWLYLKTRSLWPPLTAHLAQNLIVVAAAP